MNGTQTSTLTPAKGTDRPTSAVARRLLVLAFTLGTAGLLEAPATAQVLLYENRLPDGYAYVRFTNTLPTALSLQPAGFADKVNLGVEGPARVSAYYTVEKVAGRSLAVSLSANGGDELIQFELKPGSFNTVLIGRLAGKADAKVVVDQAEINQTRARLAFYNAVPDCAAAGLQLEPSGSSVFSGVASQTMRGRSVNPTSNARVRVACGTLKAGPLNLGALSAGGQYSIWYMAPSGTPVAFMSENTIAPYLR